MIRVGIITSSTAYEHIMEIAAVMENKYKIIYFKYKDFSEVEKICHDNLDQVDAYVFSGWYAYHMIKDKSLFEKVPCFNFPKREKEELYKLLLKLSIECSGLDLSRTYIDCINESNNYLELKEIIPEDHFPYAYSYPIDEHLPQKIFDTHLKLWKEGKIDRSITRSGSIEAKLRAEGIKTYYLFPSKESIVNTFSAVSNYFKIKELDNSQVAIGHITLCTSYMPSVNFDYEFEMKQITLYQTIVNFLNENNISNIVEKYNTRHEVLISKGDLKEITANYSHCALLDYLKRTLPFKVNVGWGVGTNIIAARQNAQYANLESERHDGDCSFVITEQSHVIGPLTGKNCLSYKNINNPNIDNISKNAKLSPVTIQKLIGIVEKLNTNELSASDIAYYLGITERSANRIINKLVKSENAVPLHTKSDKLRGRPKQIYAINLPVNGSHDTI